MRISQQFAEVIKSMPAAIGSWIAAAPTPGTRWAHDLVKGDPQM